MLNLLPRAAYRVASSTHESAQDRIVHDTRERIDHYAARLDDIEERLDALDREWDTERLLETNAATLTLAGLALGATVDRRWLLLSGVVAAFLLQHGLQGWCPPLPILRRMGVRTAREIEAERYALKAARGDFEGVRRRGERAADATGRL
jgi:hypothetical protein